MPTCFLTRVGFHACAEIAHSAEMATSTGLVNDMDKRRIGAGRDPEVNAQCSVTR